MTMKKIYQRPVIEELLGFGDISLLTESHFTEMDPEPGGGIDPGTQVDTGLGRGYDFDSSNE